MNFLSKNLRYLRKRFAVKQEQLALQVGKRQTTVGNWENKVSEPNVEELVTISNFFGVTLDVLVLTDLEKGNLITEEHVKKFQGEGNLIGNRISNLKPVSGPGKTAQDASPGSMNEPQEAYGWAVLKILKEMDEKLDGVRDSVEEIKKKR